MKLDFDKLISSIPESVMLLLNPHGVEIRKPNFMLTKDGRKGVSKKKGEVPTPRSIVQMMISGLLRESPDCLEETVMEITCGDCPFMADMYDRATGEMVDLYWRGGILDRKLRKIPKGEYTLAEMRNPVREALRSCYGYELDESLLVLGRIILWRETFDYFPELENDMGFEAAEIISVNFIQMDGLSGFCSDGSPGMFWDWEEGQLLFYNDMKCEYTGSGTMEFSR